MRKHWAWNVYLYYGDMVSTLQTFLFILSSSSILSILSCESFNQMPKKPNLTFLNLISGVNIYSKNPQELCYAKWLMRIAVSTLINSPLESTVCCSALLVSISVDCILLQVCNRLFGPEEFEEGRNGQFNTSYLSSVSLE